MPARTGFSLIELIMVIAVIVILASLVIASMRVVLGTRDHLITVQRMEQVLNTLARVGTQSGTITMELQIAISGLGGTTRFVREADENYTKPSDGLAWHKTFPDPDAVAPGNPVVTPAGDGAPLVLAYPWGQDRRYPISESWYLNGYEHLVSGEDVAPAPERHRIHELWPDRSADILAFLHIVPSAARYHDDRSPKRPWNDAWGNPLVVAYALYQPPEYLGGDPTLYRDHYLRQAQSLYQYNRSLYVTVAAGGPRLDPVRFPSGLGADWADNLQRLWQQACAVTMPNADLEWTEQSFRTAPWGGVWKNRVGDLECFISAPVELK